MGYQFIVAMLISGLMSCGQQGLGGRNLRTPHVVPVAWAGVPMPAGLNVAALDLKPGNKLRPTDAATIRDYMNDHAVQGDFGPVAPPAPAETSAPISHSGALANRRGDDACVVQGMQSLIMQAHGDTVLLTGDIDLSACLNDSLSSTAAETGAAVEAASEQMRVSLSMTCVGEDLGRFDGKEYRSLVTYGEHPCLRANEARVLFETDDLQNARLRQRTPQGLVVREEGRRTVHVDAGPDGNAAVYLLRSGHFERQAWTSVDRQIVTRSRATQGGNVVIDSDEGQEDYLRIEQPQTALSGAERWLISRNGWQGEISRNAEGGDVAWRMHDSATGNELEGSGGPGPGASVMD